MTKRRACGAAAFLTATLTIGTAAADDATITIGHPIEPEPTEPQRARSDVPDDAPIAREPELRRSAVRVALGPTGITTGKGFGYGVGLGADFGSGSVGARLSATWLRGEGTTGSGTSTPTGDSVGQYQGEITLDLHKRGPIHPVIGMGAGVVHVSRPDHQSGFAGVGTGRFALEYALGLEDADVRVGASLLGGVVGPVDDEIKDLRAYALTGVHLAIGF